jgi:hypothetical protein
MCPAYLRGFDRWPSLSAMQASPAGQRMGCANQVPYSLAGYVARDFRRAVLVLAADLCTIISRVLLTRCSFSFRQCAVCKVRCGPRLPNDPSGLVCHDDSRDACWFAFQ